MKILLLMTLSLIIHSLCFAHSGNVLNTVSNYLPVLIPLIAGIAAFGKRFIAQILNFLKNIHK